MNPANVISPNAGSGASQTFSVSYFDPNGSFTDLNVEYLLFNSNVNASAAYMVAYSRPGNAFYLFNDTGSGFVPGSITPGSPGTLSNSQCTINGTGSSASGSGNYLTLNLPITFTKAFYGPKNIYTYASYASGDASGWQIDGTWTGTNNLPPTAISVTPGSGTGITHSFSFALADPDAYYDISATYLLLNSSLSASNGCLMAYGRQANVIYLFNDAGSGLVPGSLTLGGSGTLSNSQCTINAAASGSTGSGNNLNVTVSLTLSPAFSGLKTTFAYVIDSGGLNSGWQVLGTWSRTPNQSPAAVSVTPNTGNGSSQTFTFTYSDPDGASDLNVMYQLFNSSLSLTNACAVVYFHSANVFYLFNDVGSGFVPGSLTPGGAGSLSNSQCSVTSGGTVTTSGNSLSVPMHVAFISPAFSGLKNAFRYATNVAGAASGWQQLGTWVAPEITTRQERFLIEGSRPIAN